MKIFKYLLMVFGMTLAMAEASAATKPNVVFILIDDYGWADVGVYGSKFYKTPNIDKMAAQGARFTDGYAACPVCSPTRASIMTGKYPARLQITDWLPGRGDKPDQKLAVPKIQQQLPLAEVTLAEALKANGYVTAHIGKWHLGGEGFEPQKQGFDVNVGGDHTGTPLSYFAPFEAVDRRAGNVKRPMPGLEKSEPGEYLTDRLGLEAEKFIEANKSKPFFLYLSHYGVHTPMRAKADLIAKYKSDGKVGTQTNAIYAAMIESMDDSVGRVLKKLEDLKLAENTLVVFTSDNGGLCVVEGPNTPATINSPLREGKGYLYEGGIRTPWIIQWPGVVKAGTVLTNPVSSVDFYPTILEATGTPMPKENKVDGVSLVALLKSGAAPKRDALYWHYPHYSNQGGRPGGAIREGDLKLIEFYDDGRLELFDVRKDKGESRNLAEEQKATAIRLQRKLDQWRRDVKAQMMEENPAYVANPQAANGDIVLQAKSANIHGTMVRYEPLPHKNTLGFWVRAEDSVSWDFTVTKPGKFTVEALQGCGTGNGGSEVEFRVGEQKLKLVVEDTGHFQNFKPKELGSITIGKPGRYTLKVQPLTKAKAAVMDLRMVTLKAEK
jgi:arylsulfatase A-like enzyme